MNSTKKTLRFALAGAIAVASLAGCGGGAGLARLNSAEGGEASEELNGDGNRSVARSEAAVERTPRSASLRAELGHAYLKAGRFESAALSFDDAMQLGDNSARTALSMALAKTAAGHGRDAVAILDDWRDTIPASDLGLAMALAGETGRGVSILADALRGGENTPKLRQNLAYAYALDGRWNEARLMVEQDVPAGEVDQRISDWAMQGKPGDTQQRIASLLGVPMRGDPGMPQRLALDNTPSAEQLAAEATAVQPQVAEPAPTPSLAVNSEAPEAAETASPEVALEIYNPPVQAAAAEQPAGAPAAAPVAPFATAFADAPARFGSPVASLPEPSAAPVAQPRAVAAARPVAVPTTTVRFALPKAKKATPRAGSHLVQLGSFASAQGARRAWGIYTTQNPSLREYRMVITPAVVRGKNYWRVAAAGFDGGTARGMCSTVRTRGGACFAYAATSAPAGAVPTQRAVAAAGPRMARRR